MDSVIERFPYYHDGDLALCEPYGVAYQRDQTRRVPYGDEYLAKVDGYESSDIAKAVNRGRCAMLARHLYGDASVLDIGAGSGAFVRAAREVGFNALGFDVIPAAVRRLRTQGLDWHCDPAGFDAVTLWDTIEHMEDPGAMLTRLRPEKMLFASIPVFSNLKEIRQSKHYRPGEHLYYWTAAGFVAWADRYGLRLVETSDHEIEGGRESIGAFAFRAA